MGAKNKKANKDTSISVRVNSDLLNLYRKEIKNSEKTVAENQDLLLISTILQRNTEFEKGFEESPLMSMTRIALSLATNNENFDYISAIEYVEKNGKEIYDMCTTMSKLTGKTFNDVIDSIVSQIEIK
ncbi:MULTISPECIES: hypothetical protein [Flammeovirga]|uniref:Uncharacterized protein n=1 Tax=Flammeovirga agarivorans TaxID=2726742 RepID=A0A7X8SPB8_9BACT|nr:MULTISPECIES: hypothetical protein [Flammeovirga]NLR93852.1 hypothetical protein [Flammeovirga agarivorans]